MSAIRAIMGLPARFWAKTAIEDHGYATPCFSWIGARVPGGYGTFSVRGKTRSAHRVAYEAMHGSIPGHLQIDHLCRNRACVNADHLEAVTPRENQMRSESVAAVNAAKTHCPQGHEYTPENTRVRSGRGRVVHRECRTCVRAQGVIRDARRRSVKPG